MKPFTILVQETEQEIVETINKSNIPAYVLKQILQGIYNQLENIEQQEIQKYMEGNKELDNSSFSNKKKKGSDK